VTTTDAADESQSLSTSCLLLAETTVRGAESDEVVPKMELSRSSSGYFIFNHFRIQVAVSEAKRPSRNRDIIRTSRNSRSYYNSFSRRS
jgi:hypothetical protein